MSSTREIKRRINSVSSISKITKAMELVSAAKMKKAVAQVLATRGYANIAWDTLIRLSKKVGGDLHPLLTQSKDIQSVGIVVITSNRGLCGGFNTNTSQKAKQHIKEKYSDVKNVEIITLGQKGYDALKKLSYTMKADFEKADVTKHITDVYPLTRFVIDEFLEKRYDVISVVYMDYYSALSQKPRAIQLLPLDINEIDPELGDVKAHDKSTEDDLGEGEVTLEPSPEVLLDEIIPKILEVKFFQAVLESEASEHSARMMAMKNANENAKDMISSLKLRYNRARQAGITQEISEISAGKAALE